MWATLRSQRKQATQLSLQELNRHGATMGAAASPQELRRLSSGCSPQDQLVIVASSRLRRSSQENVASSGSAQSDGSPPSPQDQLVIAASSRLRRSSQENVTGDEAHLSGRCGGSARRPSRAPSMGSGSARSDGSARRPSIPNDASPCGTSRSGGRRMSNPNLDVGPGGGGACRGGGTSTSPSRGRRMSNPNTGKSEDGSEGGGGANISLRTFGRTDTCAEQIAASAVKNELHNNLRTSFAEASPESGPASFAINGAVGAGEGRARRRRRRLQRLHLWRRPALWLEPWAEQLVRGLVLLAVAANVLAFPFLFAFRGPVGGEVGGQPGWLALLLCCDVVLWLDVAARFAVP